MAWGHQFFANFAGDNQRYLSTPITQSIMTNYHCHSHYCDGTEVPESYIVAAIEKQMQGIGFSSHSPVPFASSWNMPQTRLAGYLAEIDRLKVKYADRIQVFKSLEVDYVPGLVGPESAWVKQAELDYVIGSVHYTQPLPDGTWWSIDDHLGAFLNGLKQVYDNDIQKAVKYYFALQRQMIQTECPHIIGHFDKIKMHNRLQPLFDETAEWYRTEVRHLLEVIAQTGCMVEINTKSFEGNGLLFPGVEHFDWLRELAIPLVINSDSHHPNHLTSGFQFVADHLLAHHINEVHVLAPSGWLSMSIAEWIK